MRLVSWCRSPPGLGRHRPLAVAPLRWRSRERSLHLAPPFLVDDYIPRFLTLSEIEASKKRSRAYGHLRNCNLCPRLCGVNRYETTGMCLIGGDTAKVNVIAPHFGEGKAHVVSRCDYDTDTHPPDRAVCPGAQWQRKRLLQNHDISHQRNGMDLTPEELADWFLKLQEVGSVHNINLITPEHVVPQVALALLHARTNGLTLPIIYNTSAYDSLASLELLDGLVDMYLPDFKVWEPTTSRRLLKADDYAATARESIKAMHAQVGDLCFTPDGIAKKGVLVRHLVMPGLEEEGATIMQWLAEELSRDVFVNIMEQYHPDAYVGKPKRAGKSQGGNADDDEGSSKVRYADINRAVTDKEVSAVRKAAEKAGLWRFCDPPRHYGFNL
ncbi:pyruvate formate lyase activating [Grosmannia clavigera kw1407]|uniref:Pyruvate formate lyase activating n=1 Tax=Grosmannia clavigera (strain kw1407 / UAMH 11150) TaxID=655863 RepID=F0XFH2_GROCL|nr:pyruvate formate lyase activating [Grosmannia clavigera kw1407]EFX03681.1 pyruvate formate lyase activating [Grosmannia clavigera kw1407]